MKALLSLLLITLTLSCFANETNVVCRSSGSVALVLHKEVNGTVSENADNHWAVTLPYDVFSGGEFDGAGIDTVTGSAACSTISVKSAPDGSSYNGGAAVPGDVNTFARMAAANAGNKCWCKLDGPITSWWTYVHEYADADACASGCTSYCATGFATNTQMSNGRKVRNALIDGVW